MRKGFTLIEVMFALVVLTIAILGFASMYFSTERMNQFDADRIQCYKIAHQTMELLLAMDYDDLKTMQFESNAFTEINNLDLSEFDENASAILDITSPLNSTSESELTSTNELAEEGIQYDPSVKLTADGKIDYEADTRGIATSIVSVQDDWNGSALKIIVEVPEFGVRIVSYRVNPTL